MATDGTWIGSAAHYLDYKHLDNWLGGVAYADGDGATITLAPTDPAYIPTTNRPTTVTDHYHFVVASAVTVTLDNWLNGALIGNVVVNHADAEVTCAAAITGTTTVTAGVLNVSGNLGNAPADTVVIDEQGFLNVLAAITIAGAVTNDDQFNILGAYAVVCTGLFTNNGSVDGVIGSAIDFNGGVAGGGTWGTGVASVLTLVSRGDFNSAGGAMTWNLGVGSTLTISDTGTVNLGTTLAIANLTLHVTADTDKTVTLAGAPSVAGFTLNTNGTLAGGSVTLTLGAGAFTSTKGTVTGTLNLVLGSGGITYTLGTYSSATFNVTAAVSTGLLKWATSGASKLSSLTIAAGVTATQSGNVYTKALTVTGAIDTNGWSLGVAPAADNALSVGSSGSISTPSGGAFAYFLSGNRIQTTFVTNANTKTYINGQSSTMRTLTCTTFNIGSGALQIDGDDVGQKGTLSAVNLTAGAISLGKGDTWGTLTLAGGVCSFTSLAKTAGATGTLALNCGSSRINFSGDIALAGIVTDFATAALFATANNKTITGGASIAAAGADIFANGNTLIVTDMGTAVVRCWNGCTVTGTKANVQSLPGSPDDY